MYCWSRSQVTLRRWFYCKDLCLDFSWSFTIRCKIPFSKSVSAGSFQQQVPLSRTVSVGSSQQQLPLSSIVSVAPSQQKVPLSSAFSVGPFQQQGPLSGTFSVGPSSPDLSTGISSAGTSQHLSRNFSALSAELISSSLDTTFSADPSHQVFLSRFLSAGSSYQVPFGRFLSSGPSQQEPVSGTRSPWVRQQTFHLFSATIGSSSAWHTGPVSVAASGDSSSVVVVVVWCVFCWSSCFFSLFCSPHKLQLRQLLLRCVQGFYLIASLVTKVLTSIFLTIGKDFA